MKFKRMVMLPILAGLIMAMGAGCATTQSTAPEASAQADTSWQFHDIVTADFVKQYTGFPKPENVMIIDARPKKTKYDKGHLPWAVSIPDSQFDKMTDRLPQDKNTLLIYYCGGLKCKLSHKSAKKAEALGYTNVKVFAEGYPVWMSMAGHYPWVTEDYVKSRIEKNDGMLLVDARPKRKKYDKGHITTAISIPDSQFDKMTDQLPREKDALLVFYCGGFKCKLSHKSAAKAIAMGYTNVKVFAAGYPVWKEKYADFQVAGSAAAPAQMKAGKEEGSIDNDLFTQIVTEKPETILLVDVRDSDEFQTGSLKSAVNIPVDDLEKKIKTLPTDKPIVFICGTGARSGESYYMVKDLRPEIKDVYYLEAELTFKKDGAFDLKEITQ